MPEIRKTRKLCHKCHKVYDKKLKTCKVCSSCHSITYCGQECQEEDWPRHRVNCVPVRLAIVNKLNGIIGLVASKNFKKGDVIYTETALIVDEGPDSMTSSRCHEKVKMLSDEQKKEFYKLKVKDEEYFSDLRMNYVNNYSHEHKILISNIYPFDKTKRVHCLFLHSCHLNRSFAPNARQSYSYSISIDESKPTAKVVAIKDIKKGKEIKIQFESNMNPYLNQIEQKE